MEKLVISDDEGKTTVVPLVRDELYLGRQEGNTIRLTERNVSRRHALIRRNGAGYVIEDLGSYNGVRVNGRLIEAPTALTAGDRVAIGDYLLSFEDAAVPAEDVASDRRTTARHSPLRRRDPSGGPPPAAGSEQDLRATARDRPRSVAPAPEPLRSPPARLVLLSAPAPGAEFALSRPRLRVGRAEDLEVWINHKSISRLHAVIEVDGDRYGIRDADSANGVRVNGERVGVADLRPGDIVDLGQVRLRFVAPGEAYRFDLDRTMELAAAAGRGRRDGVHPAIVGAVIVGAVVFSSAVGLALSGRGGPLSQMVGVTTGERTGELPSAVPSPGAAPAPAETPRPSETGVDAVGADPETAPRSTPAPSALPGEGDGSEDAAPPGAAAAGGSEAPAVGPPGEAQAYPARGDDPRAGTPDGDAVVPGEMASVLAEAVAACRAALQDDRVEDAVAAGTRAVGIDPDHPEGTRCLELARSRVADRRVFARGVAALAAGDVDGAHFAFGALSEDSPLRSREEVAQARARFAERRLELVEGLARESPETARRELAPVLEERRLLPTALRRRAERLARSLRRPRGR
ncbi:MAG TPA: FHA domain-containing protein [Polyangiaceae bacterium LLY-WYZ-14_1]|nr:FHA domain-containing protein [Polyangiaceae bacterium LLY-WYZ-14_1]